MHRRGAARLALIGVLTGGLIATGVTPVLARPAEPDLPGVTARAKAKPHQPHRKRTRLTARIAPRTVSAGEPATLRVRMRPATKGVRLRVERRVGGRWAKAGRVVTGADGRAVLRLDTAESGTQRLRVRRTSPRRAARATSRPATVGVVATDDALCRPRTQPVDALATSATRCLAARIDRWQAAGTMAIGQQLNVSNEAYAAPLEALPQRLPVVGFDLTELGASEAYGFAVRPLDYLAELGEQGTVLSVSWHPDNPGTGAPSSHSQRTWTRLDQLVATTPSVARTRFWADFDAGMALLKELQDEHDVAVVFRPLHEANGAWFWWGRPAAETYRQLWAAMQARASALGVHNILWAYSFNAASGSHIASPTSLLPAKVDLAGLDSYDPEAGDGNAADRLDTTGYDAVARTAPRAAFTEVGPYDSPDGAWDPAVIAKAAAGVSTSPAWAMLWFDDGGGRKQLASLGRGPAWLASCPDGFCTVAR